MPKILVHICCAVCGAALIEELKKKFEPILFFYNPNVHPFEEYSKRRQAVQELAKIYEVQLVEGIYEQEKWLARVKGLENEPEGGKRCAVCFEMRLKETALFAQKSGINFFTATLALSPHKNEEVINGMGLAAEKETKVGFLNTEKLGIEKKDIWQKTRVLAKTHGFYHQNYCGCFFSFQKRNF